MHTHAKIWRVKSLLVRVRARRRCRVFETIARIESVQPYEVGQ